MLFTLEAIRAEAGDCLVLHYGDPDEPRVLVIDGGPTEEVYERLRQRLDELRDAGGFTDHDQPLPIELVMVSHIDDDHIDGILHLTQQLIDQAGDPPFTIKSMWHNSFDDVIGNGAEDLRTAAHGDVEAASQDGDFFAQDLVQHDTALVLASIGQGRTLRSNAAQLGLRPPLLVAKQDEQPRNFGDGLTLRLVGPLEAQVEKLQREWEKHLKTLEKKGQLATTEGASFADKSVANLASLVVLAESGGKTILLTGDARADYLRESLELQGLLDANGHLHVDLFKLPHHGSSRNVTKETFRDITADHYVISADGKHGNPDVPTFKMLFDGRAEAGLVGQAFTIYMTYAPESLIADKGKPYPLEEMRALLAKAKDDGHIFELIHPATEEPSIRVDLLERLQSALSRRP